MKTGKKKIVRFFGKTLDNTTLNWYPNQRDKKGKLENPSPTFSKVFSEVSHAWAKQ
jgi:hypothetical protein